MNESLDRGAKEAAIESGLEIREHKGFNDLPELRRERIANAAIVFEYIFSSGEDPTEGIDPVEGLNMLRDAEDVIDQINFDNTKISRIPEQVLNKSHSAVTHISPHEVASLKTGPEGHDTEAAEILIGMYNTAIKIHKAESDLIKVLADKYRSQLAELGVMFNEFDYSRVKYKDVDIEYIENFLEKRKSEKISKRKDEIIEQLESGATPEQLREFPENVRSEILKNIFSIELNQGCTVRCTFCAFGTSGKITDTLPFEDVVWLLRRTKDIIPYYASDPLDYRDSSGGKERTYEDVLTVALVDRDRIFTSTAYPRKSGDVFNRVKDKITRISISDMNKKRLAKDGHLTITELGSVIITDPDLYYPRSTDRKLNLHSTFGQLSYRTRRRLSMNAKETYFLNQDNIVRTGRNAVKPHEDGHANGDFIADSIACNDGVVMSGKGARNSVQMLTTHKYPNGTAEVAITKESLSGGALKIEQISKNVKFGEKVQISDLLDCCVVQAPDEQKKHKYISKSTVKEVELAGIAIETIYFIAYSDDFSESISGAVEFSAATGLIKNIKINSK
ncbi:MAG: hypothetical protein ABIA47_02010 [bacterium]